MIQTPPFRPRQLALRPLPYPTTALQPVLSQVSVETHYTQHYVAYVNKANAILASSGGEAGLAAAPQHVQEKWDLNSRAAWLHELWWESLVPGGSDPTRFFVDHLGGPGGILRFRANLLEEGLAVIGSGWIFISRDVDQLVVHSSPNHDYPNRDGCYPALVIDVWEHVHYLDYQADRQRYLERIISLINWPAVEWRILGRSGTPPQ